MKCPGYGNLQKHWYKLPPKGYLKVLEDVHLIFQSLVRFEPRHGYINP